MILKNFVWKYFKYLIRRYFTLRLKKKKIRKKFFFKN